MNTPDNKINGKLLTRLLRGGYKNLCANVDYLNDINVFPVTDGDTGTNIKKTYEMGINNLVDSDSHSEVFGSFVDGLLMGSRGNSGLIISQYFAGLYQEIKGIDEVCAGDVCNALVRAYEAAKGAVLKPVEGTILTVMREGAEKAKAHVRDNMPLDIFFTNFSKEIYTSLKATPKKLEVLKEHSVVDSGAAGFYLIFDGFRKEYCDTDENIVDLPSAEFKNEVAATIALKHRYCTEFRVSISEGSLLNKNDAVKKIAKMGDSVAVALNGNVLKVHIHTNEPDKVVEMFTQYGDIKDKKVDDMEAQSNIKTDYSYAILGDATCDLSDELRARYQIDGYFSGHMSVPGGKEILSTLDFSYMPCKKFYSHLKSNFKKYHGAPLNVGEMVNYAEPFLKAGKDLLLISLSSALSVTYNVMVNTAKTLQAKYPDKKIIVVDGKKYSVGTGLLMLKASQLRSNGFSIEETASAIEEAKNKIHQMGSMDDMFFIASKGRISNAKAFLATIAGIKTLADFDKDGNVTVLGKVSGYKKAYRAILEYISKTIVDPQNEVIIVAHSNREKLAKKLAGYIEKQFSPKQIIIQDIYPATGINTGPGLLCAYYFGTEISDGLESEKAIMEQLLAKG